MAPSSSSSSSKVKLYADLGDRARVTPGKESVVKLVVSLGDAYDGEYSRFAARATRNHQSPNSNNNVNNNDFGNDAYPFVETIEVEWRGIERLDPVWVQPTSNGSGGNAMRMQNSLKTGERFIARSPPGSVLENVLLQPNERHVLKFTIQIPPGLPPTYRGQICRYYYSVIFTCKLRGEAEPVVIEMPLKVHAGPKPPKSLSGTPRFEDLRISESFNSSGSRNGSGGGGSGGGSSSSNNNSNSNLAAGSGPVTPRGVLPSWSDRSSSDTWGDDVELRQATLQGGDADENLREFLEMSRMQRSQQRTYAITTGNKFVCKITPANPLPVVACGELVSGVFDFENTKPESMETMPVQSYSWTLETEEIALSSIEGGGSGNSNSNSSGTADSSKLPVLRKIWAEGSERCVEHIRRTFFSASVPLEAPGSFRTTKIELAWVLRFEFNVGSDKVEWRYPIEVMSRTYAKKSRAI
jgi:hypothetical protein